MINWNITKEEAEVIRKIAVRAVAIIISHDLAKSPKLLDIEMDITATHLNGCPLKLDDLLTADASDFGHDVFGIEAFLDRETGTLRECFVPRFAA